MNAGFCFTINASCCFNENVTVLNTPPFFVTDIQYVSGDVIGATSGTVAIHGSLIDNADARFQYVRFT